MQILILVILLLIFALCILLSVISFFNYQMLQKITEHLGLEPEISEKKKAQIEAQQKKEKSDEAFTNMLVELSEEKKAKDNAPFGTYTFNELDAFDELEHTETDPEKLLKILEYGLPDEELETIIKKLESGKQGRPESPFVIVSYAASKDDGV